MKPERSWFDKRRRLPLAGAAGAAVAACLGILCSRPWSAHHPPAPDPEAQRVIAQMGDFLRDGRDQDALVLARRHLAEQPKTVGVHHAIGLILGARNDPRGAAAEFEAELQRSPDSSDSHAALGVALAQIHELDRAITHLKRSLELAPGRTDSALALGQSLVELGRYAEAEQALGSPGEHESAPRAYTRGLVAVKLGHSESALAAFRRALAADNTHRGALHELGRLLVGLGRGEEGEALLARHAELQHQDEELARVKAPTEAPGASAQSFVTLAEALIDSGQPAAAAAAYTRALTLDPANPSAAFGLATAELDLGQDALALRAIEQGSRIYPESATGHFLLGLVRIRQGNRAEAKRLLDRSRELGTWAGATFLRLGTTCLAAGDQACAEGSLRRALALNPSDAPTLLALGLALAGKGNLTDARAVLESGASLGDPEGDFAMALGILAFAREDQDAARVAFLSAIRRQRARLFGTEAEDHMLSRLAAFPQASPAADLYRQLRRGAEGAN